MAKNKKKGGKKPKNMTTWTSKENSLPVVHMTFEAKNKLDLYLACCDEEISGLGRVAKIGSKFVITDIILLPQEVSSSSTDLDEKELDEFILTEIEEGRNPGDLKVWWHSHVNMSCFWSGTDAETIETFKNDWFISIVGNKSGIYRARLDLFEPFRYCFDELTLAIMVPPMPEMKEAVEAEIKEKVKRKTYPIQSYTYCGARRYNRETKEWEEVDKKWDIEAGKWVETVTPIKETTKSWRSGYYEDDEYGYGNI